MVFIVRTNNSSTFIILFFFVSSIFRSFYSAKQKCLYVFRLKQEHTYSWLLILFRYIEWNTSERIEEEKKTVCIGQLKNVCYRRIGLSAKALFNFLHNTNKWDKILQKYSRFLKIRIEFSVGLFLSLIFFFLFSNTFTCHTHTTIHFDTLAFLDALDSLYDTIIKLRVCAIHRFFFFQNSFFLWFSVPCVLWYMVWCILCLHFVFYALSECTGKCLSQNKNGNEKFVDSFLSRSLSSVTSRI